MIWVSYRQARLQLAIGLAALVVAAVLFGLTGPHLADLAASEDFLTIAARKRINTFLYISSAVLLSLVPALIGAFWGAPLVAREIEAGTHRLAWTQSISRTRWLATRMGMGALATLVVSGLLTLAVNWWASPIDTAVARGDAGGIFNLHRMNPSIFGVRGVVPIGYSLFAFALGVALGLAIRSTLIAIGLTLAVMVVVQAVLPSFLRAHLATPAEQRVVISSENLAGLNGQGRPGTPEERLISFEVQPVAPDVWTLDNLTVTAEGTVPDSLPLWMTGCIPGQGQEMNGGSDPTIQACQDRMAAEGYRQKLVYFPASDFWTLQWRETGLLTGAAALLAGFAFWRIRQDL